MRPDRQIAQFNIRQVVHIYYDNNSICVWATARDLTLPHKKEDCHSDQFWRHFPCTYHVWSFESKTRNFFLPFHNLP